MTFHPDYRTETHGPIWSPRGNLPVSDRTLVGDVALVGMLGGAVAFFPGHRGRRGQRWRVGPRFLAARGGR